MKVLWVVNSILNDLSVELYGKASNGVWMDALLSDFKGKEDYKIVVATTAKRKDVFCFERENVKYYLLPDAPPILYNENKKENRDRWKALIDKEKPDIIQIWGTEFSHGLCCLEVAKDIPSVIYMQGHLGSIARFYLAGIPRREIEKSITIRDILKRDTIFDQQKKFYRSSVKEKKMFLLSGAIISENEWCNAYVKAEVPSIKIYSCPLTINTVFSKSSWDINSVERHSIICNASGYTIKGLHILLKAVALLKGEFPDIKLYVPGTPVKTGGGIKGRLRRNGYTKYIETLIGKLGIKDNIVWLGSLAQKDLAEEYAKRHVFVMPSAIENHSSSLKEAMTVGMPCISSSVGGIPEYVVHGKNGLLYRFEEYEVTADLVKKVFLSDELAETLSENAKKDMSALHNGASRFEKMAEIYKRIMEKKD